MGDQRRPLKANKGRNGIPGALRKQGQGASYEFVGIRYELPRNSEGHVIHGLLLTEPFEVEDMDERRVVLRTTLRHTGYPHRAPG
ncbi:MAG: hypothetical protein JHC13_03905 [Acidilobus sp.]|jgi:aldose 1-epimerase|nr:hypothetical protein [Acidilobus sp.]